MSSEIALRDEATRQVTTKPSDEVSDTPSSSSSSSPLPSAPMETPKSILEETVKGLKEVASVSYASVRNWASSPRFSQKNGGGDMESSHQKAARKALSDLMSPFIACHDGIRDIYKSQNAERERSFSSFPDFSDYKEAFRVLNHPDSETVFSMDTTIDDEMNQLHRLASWGTNATTDTFDTETYIGERGAITDDDGRLIPAALLETANKRREKRTRTRVVRFDYPPISSLRECPRHDPDNLSDLFFTEEELDEIEADRSSAHFVDDIEIVAVASARSSESEALSVGQSPRQSRSADSIESKKGNQGSPSALSRKPRSALPHPRRPAKGSWVESSSSFQGGSSSGNPSSSSRESTRLIKGVQIYLRERSTGKSSNKKS